MKTSRNRLKSKKLWSPEIYERVRANCTYNQSIEIIDRIHKEILNFVIDKRRGVVIPHIGELTLDKFRPRGKIYKFRPGESRLQVNHHTQGYIYKFHLKFLKTYKMRAYKFKPCRKIKLELSNKIINRELPPR